MKENKDELNLSSLFSASETIDEKKFINDKVVVEEGRVFKAYWSNSSIDPLDLEEMDLDHLKNISTLLGRKNFNAAKNIVDAEIKIREKGDTYFDFDAHCQFYMENADCPGISTIKAEFQDTKMFRIMSSEAEIVLKHGDDWRDNISGGWPSTMDHLFGKEMTYKEFIRCYASPTGGCFIIFDDEPQGYFIPVDLIEVI
jgi:hypothetical protein